MRKTWFAVVLGMLALATFTSCGSSSGSCANSAACGGDIVGTWTIQSSCVSASASMFNDMCPTATVSTSNFTIAGSVVYKADLTYSATSTMSGSATVHLPASCLTSGAVTLTCDQLNQLIAAKPQAGVTVHCAGTSDCTCMETLTNAPSSASGTYTTTAAGLLTETSSSDGTSDQSDFCVKGTTLTESPHPGSSMMGESVSGTITLTKS